MADFAANLISNQAIAPADVEGGSISANLLANNAITSAATSGGTVQAVIVTVPAVLTGPAGGGSVSAAVILFGNSTSLNRVFDAVANKLVTWPSILPDRDGTRYPGPGVFGVTTSGYVLLN